MTDNVVKPGPEWQDIYTLVSPRARELADLAGIQADLTFVAEVSDRLAAALDQEPSDLVLSQALWTSALVAYARCFGRGKRLGLSEADLQALAGGGVLEFHEYQMNMRNKHIAHSVNPFESTTIGALVGTLPSGSRGVIGTAVLALRNVSPDAAGARSLARLARALVAHLQTRIDPLREIVLKEAQGEDLADLLRRPVFDVEIPEPARSGVPRGTQGLTPSGQERRRRPQAD